MIGLFYGTRPEYIKLLPLVEEFKKSSVEFVLYQVKQHTDLIDGCDFDIVIDISQKTENRLNSIFISILQYSFESLDYVLVQGDTSTAAAVAMNAFHQQIPVMHLEAGLRTFDKQNPYPEEVNRRIISSLASIHYCPTGRDAEHLATEGFGSDQIFITGNTVLDSLRDIEPTRGNEVLITLHRRENHDKLEEWFAAIEKLAEKYPQYSFTFPMHPSPAVQKHKDIFSKVDVCDPIPFDDMKRRLASCALVITDSGGIQEECSFFKKVCLVCRKTTERPSDFGLLCLDPEALSLNFDMYHGHEVTSKCPYGDGYAARKITKSILTSVR